MKGILIRIKDGHQMDGEGEKLGRDVEGVLHTFWKSSGHMEIPLDLAIALEKEEPQRFEIVNRELAGKLVKGAELPTPEEPGQPIVDEKPIVEEVITFRELKKMSKDALNDWAAKRGYDVNPMKQSKKTMIVELMEQIKEKTGKEVE